MEIKNNTCPFCGEDITEGTQKCPHCNEWLVQTQPASSAQASTPETVEPKSEPQGNTVGLLSGTAGIFRLAAIVVMTVLSLVWVFLLVVATQNGTSQGYDNAVVADSLAYGDSIDESDTTLSDSDAGTVSNDKSSMQHLTTYWGFNRAWKCDYYWDAESRTLNICTDDGDIDKTYNLGDDYGIYSMEGENGVMTTEYNNNVYFVGHRCGNGSGWMIDCMVFYLSPAVESNDELHVLVDECAQASFSGSTVRANFPEILNENTASCEADYQYADHWKTIKLE